MAVTTTADKPERMTVVPRECIPLTQEQERLILAEAVHARHEGYSSIRIRFENETKIRVIPEREGRSRAA